jgi:hypothetical protein
MYQKCPSPEQFFAKKENTFFKEDIDFIFKLDISTLSVAQNSTERVSSLYKLNDNLKEGASYTFSFKDCNVDHTVSIPCRYTGTSRIDNNPIFRASESLIRQFVFIDVSDNETVFQRANNYNFIPSLEKLTISLYGDMGEMVPESMKRKSILLELDLFNDKVKLERILTT